MKRIFALLILLATSAIAQTDSTDILITIREDGDTTQIGRWRAGMPVLIRDSWDGWGAREKLSNKFVIIRSGISKAMIDSFLVAHYDSTTGLRRKYQLSRPAIQFVKNNRDANNIVRVTPAQLRNAFKRANRLRRFGEPQRMSIIPDRLYIRWRNMLIGATPTTATVNTDGGGDYTSLAAAEAGEQKDLVTANEQLTINCSGTTADVTAVVFDGWTTDATRNIVIEGDNNTGIWDDNKYRIVFVGIGNTIDVSIPYVSIKKIGIQFGSTSTNASLAGIALNTSGLLTIESVIMIQNIGIYQAGFTTGIDILNSFGIAVVRNSNFYDFTKSYNASSACINIRSTGGTLYANNITTNNANIAYRRAGGTYSVKNSIAQNCTNGFSGTFAAESNYNISDLTGDAPGANSLNSTVANFVDASAGDFQLLAGSPGIDQGVDLSSDPNYPFNTAIDGTIRPQGSEWDIGSFEYVQPATGTDKKSRYKGFGTGFKGGWKK